MGKRTQFTVNGLNGLSKKLKDNITLNDVKRIVKTNTTELNSAMQRESQSVLTGHWEGSKFVKPTGATKRSITIRFTSGGLSGHTGPQTEYSPYLIRGTRFMAKRDFFLPPLRIQKKKFRSDLERLMK